MKVAFFGLGHMGLNMALNIQEQGIEVVGWNRSEPKRVEARAQGLEVADSINEATQRLDGEQRKVVFLMIAAGPAVDSVIFEDGQLFNLLNEGDIIIDGANSYFEDTKRRAELLSEKGIIFMDAGVSGGVEKARTGASVMVGGDRGGFDYLEKLFAAIAMENGYGYFGPSGAGHYVKMVHNGIEYAMMQAIAEGMNIIKTSEYGKEVDMLKLTDVWNHGSIIESNLVKFLHQALSKDALLGTTEPVIGSLGTGRWTVEQALKQGVPANAISAAVFARYSSRDLDSYLFKAVQAMRAEFGAHTSEERPT